MCNKLGNLETMISVMGISIKNLQMSTKKVKEIIKNTMNYMNNFENKNIIVRNLLTHEILDFLK